MLYILNNNVNFISTVTLKYGPLKTFALFILFSNIKNFN